MFRASAPAIANGVVGIVKYEKKVGEIMQAVEAGFVRAEIGADKTPTKRLSFAVAAVAILLIIPAEYQSSTLNQLQPILINFTNHSISSHYGHQLDRYQLYVVYGLIISIGQGVAGIVGCFLTPVAARSFGSRNTLFLAAGTLNFLGAFCCGLARMVGAVELFGFGHMLSTGFAWVIIQALGPSYIADCSPPHLRGVTGILITIGAYMGDLFAYILGYEGLLGSEALWPFYVSLPAFISIVAFGCNFVLPESPKDLYILNDSYLQARHRILELYGPNTDVDEIFRHFDEERDETNEAFKMSDLFRQRHLRRPLIIGFVIVVLIVCSGPFILSVYLTMILTQLKLPLHMAQGATIMSALPLPFLVYPATKLSARFGRRPFLLYGGSAMVVLLAIFLFLGELAYVGVGGSLVLAYIAAAALVLNAWFVPFGPYSIGLLLASEILPHRARAAGMSVCTLVLQLFYCVVLGMFPILHNTTGPLAILIVMIVPSTLCLIYLWKHAPETQDLHVDEIVRLWTDDHTDAGDRELLARSPFGTRGNGGSYGAIGDMY